MSKRKMKCGDLIVPLENPLGFDELGIILKKVDVGGLEYYMILWQRGETTMTHSELIKGSYEIA